MSESITDSIQSEEDSTQQQIQAGRPRANSAPVHSHHGIKHIRLDPNANDTLSRALAGYKQKCQLAKNGHGTHRERHLSMQRRREDLEIRCCRINVLLVTMQLCLGAAVTSLGFYMQTLTDSLPVKECPFWAGVPLLIAGMFGTYYCCTDLARYHETLQLFVARIFCFAFSSSCVFLCMVGSVFTGIHGNRISTFVRCSPSPGQCACLQEGNSSDSAELYQLNSGDTCDVVVTSIKDILILQCALNAIASGVCFWFITLLWKARYHEFYSGLRFYSCTSSPEQDPSQWEGEQTKYPPYQQTALPPSPIFDSICVTNGSSSKTTNVVVEPATES